MASQRGVEKAKNFGLIEDFGTGAQLVNHQRIHGAGVISLDLDNTSQGTFLVDSKGTFDPKTGTGRLVLVDDSDITFTGNGTLKLNNSNFSWLTARDGTDPPRLRNDEGHTIRDKTSHACVFS